jgi:hypothetical protein
LASRIPDLTGLLKSLQTYATGMAELTVDLLKSPLVRATKRRPIRRFRWRHLLVAGGVALVVLAIALVVPSWSCLPTLWDDLFDSSEVSTPLPANCVLGSEEASENIWRVLDSRRQERGLMLEGIVTCSMARGNSDSQLQGFYINKTLQHGRHVFLAETEPIAGGKVLFVVEACLVPRWKYLKRLAADAVTLNCNRFFRCPCQRDSRYLLCRFRYWFRYYSHLAPPLQRNSRTPDQS